MKKMLALVLCFALALCCLAGCGDKDTASNSNNASNDPTNLIEVENFVGKAKSDIEGNQDLKIKYTIEFVEDYSSTVEVGKIISQLPLAGEKFESTPTITLTVSIGPKIVEIPDVIDQPEEEAKETLENIGFTVIVSRNNHATVPSGCVYAIDPVIGEDVYNDSEVTIYVSTGPFQTELTTLPDLKGMDRIEAERQIAEAQLVVGEVTEEYSSLEMGKVVSTDPAPGQVAFGTVVNIILSRGPEEIY